VAKKTVLISGAGIGGPALAYWLVEGGFDPVIVERAPEFREGGYVVDFWGVGYDVAEQMGLMPTLRAKGYVNDRVVFVRADGRTRSGFGGDVLRRSLGDRFLSIQRGDLARAIYATVQDRVETIFGDEIATLEQYHDRVDVRFHSGTSRSFDLVIGADGLHSNVRGLLFGARSFFQHHLGFYAAAFTSPGYTPRDEHTYLSYAAPGRQISRFALRDDTTGFLFVFRKADRDPDLIGNLPAQKRALCGLFAGDKWIEWPEIKRRLESCNELYFDSVSQVMLPQWSHGRVALLGDAAYCPSLLAGEGAAFAIAGAYILARELARAGDDHSTAFESYEHLFRPFIERKQQSARAFASSFTPATTLGLFARDIVLHLSALPFVANLLLGRFVTDRFDLPNYDAP
jgi:2-polyprenyl-6-methoxyphenol hydroxylase-like FAD-dependent oxidoreductase